MRVCLATAEILLEAYENKRTAFYPNISKIKTSAAAAAQIATTVTRSNKMHVSPCIEKS